MTFLVVDDSKAIRFLMRQMLETFGHTVLGEAGTGRDAIAAYQKLRPDVVTLDIVMPETDGLECLGALKSLDPDVQVIIVSSAATMKNMMAVKEAGALHFLTKPFTLEKVREVIVKLSPKKKEAA